MQLVLFIELRAREPVFAYHGSKHIDVVHSLLLADESFNKTVGLSVYRDELPARRRWFDRDERDLCIRQLSANCLDKLFEVVKGLSGGSAGGNVVIARVEQYHFGLVWNNNPIGKKGRIP